jgi:hypothetical protein
MQDILKPFEGDATRILQKIKAELRSIEEELDNPKMIEDRVDKDLDQIFKDYVGKVPDDREAAIKQTHRDALIKERRQSLERARDQLADLRNRISPLVPTPDAAAA